MSLNLSSNGEFTPHVRYMASTSSWKMSSESGMKDFQMTEAIFDLDNIKTGWGYIGEGEAPEWVLDQSLSQAAPKPQDGREWKRGFKVNIFSKALFGEEAVREFATTGTGAIKGIEKLYEEYELQKASNQNKVPVVAFKGGVPTKVGKGNTSVPTLVITKWVDRPAAFDEQPANEAAAETASEF